MELADKKATGGGLAKAPPLSSKPPYFMIYYHLFAGSKRDEAVTTIAGGHESHVPRLGKRFLYTIFCQSSFIMHCERRLLLAIWSHFVAYKRRTQRIVVFLRILLYRMFTSGGDLSHQRKITKPSQNRTVYYVSVEFYLHC